MKFVRLPEPTFPEYAPSVTTGHYFIFGVQSDYLHRLWPNIWRDEIMDALDDHGIFQREYSTWWFKLGAYRKVMKDSIDETPDPVGGIKSRYEASYYAHCKNGEIVRVLKNREGGQLRFEDLYAGDPAIEAEFKSKVAKLMGDREPYGPPDRLHKIHYGVLYPRNGIGRPLDRATIDVLDFRR